MSVVRVFVEARPPAEGDAGQLKGPSRVIDEGSPVDELVRTLDLEMDLLRECLAETEAAARPAVQADAAETAPEPGTMCLGNEPTAPHPRATADVDSGPAPDEAITRRVPRRRTCLTVGLRSAESSAVRRLLAMRGFEIDSMPRGPHALELLDRVAFDLLLVRLPLPGMAFGQFLEAVRKPGSRCSGASLYILASPSELERAGCFVGVGANRVISERWAAPELSAALGERARLASRVKARCDAILHYDAFGWNQTLLCQTANLSETGMLLEMVNRLPNGTRFRFALNLGGATSQSVAGEAEVVRHATVESEGADGIGVRFVTLADGSYERLRAFVRQRLR